MKEKSFFLPFLPTSKDTQKIDQISEDHYGTTRELLMESAGALSAHRIQSLYPQAFSQEEIWIFAGPGNNGGDGLVVARHLHSAGAKKMHVFVLSSEGSALFKKQLERLQVQGIEVLKLSNKKSLSSNPSQNLTSFFESIQNSLNPSSLIVDALFGTGLSRDIKDPLLLKLIHFINSASSSVLSLDVPSGLDANRGVIKGQAVKAERTLSFGFAKPGFFIGEGPQCVGKQEILTIGIPLKSLHSIKKKYFLVSQEWVKEIFPRRKNQSYKGDYGALLVVAGRPGMWGSGLLASSAAFRIGAGYVLWGSHIEPLEKLKNVPEVLTQKTSHIIQELKEKNGLNLGLSQRIKAFVVGPGLSVEKDTASLIKELKKSIDHPERGSVILDADGIRACVKFQLFPLPSHWVLTPHLGELLFILNGEKESKKKRGRETKTENLSSTSQIKKDLFSAGLKASLKAGCQVLVKGYHSFLVQDSKCFLVPTGNAALSKAGSGDVLSGMIGGLLAQGLSSFEATLAASYLHGQIANEWENTFHETHSLNPSDLKDSFSFVIGKWMREEK